MLSTTCDTHMDRMVQCRSSGVRLPPSYIQNLYQYMHTLEKIKWSQFPPYQYQIVVAHYQENLQWLEPYLSLIRVYHKGGLSQPKILASVPAKISQCMSSLSNVGREGHTYLTHIIESWDSLAEKILFIQGHPFDHDFFPIPYYLLSSRPFVSFLSCHQTGCYPDMWGKIKHLQPWKKALRHRSMTPATSSFGQWWDTYLQIPRPASHQFHWAPGGIFSVSKHLIQQRPRTYYQHLRNSLQHSPNPEEGHYLERSWYHLFSYLSHKDKLTN